MSLSGHMLRTSTSQYDTITCQSKQSLQTGISSTKTRSYDRRIFHQYYGELCERRSLLPMACCRGQCKQGILDFNADRIRLDHWGPLLTAVCADRSLHHIAVRSKHLRKKVVGLADTKLKAVSVRNAPVLYTHYVLSLLMDALAGCIQRSKSLSSVELDSLPIDKEYLAPVFQAMKLSTSLQQISLRGCPLGDIGCEAVCAAVRNLPSITSLDMSQCGISSAGVAYVANMLKYQKIQRMSECWKHTLRYREANLDTIQGIRRISLNNNPIHDEGVSYLVDTLSDDLWMKALDLQECKLTDTAARQILDMLDHNTNIAIVDVRQNCDVSADLLAAIMKKLHTNNAHSQPQFGWFPVKIERYPRKKSLTETIASRFQLEKHLSKRTMSDMEEQRRYNEQRRPPVPRVRLKQRVSSSSTTPPSPQSVQLSDYRRVEEERDAALEKLAKLQCELENAYKERDEALRTVDELQTIQQSHVPEGYILIRQDVYAAMESVIRLIHTNGFKF